MKLKIKRNVTEDEDDGGVLEGSLLLGSNDLRGLGSGLGGGLLLLGSNSDGSLLLGRGGLSY